MSLADAVVGLKAYKEVDERMKKLWHDLDQAIVGPRMDIANSSPPAITVHGVCLSEVRARHLLTWNI
jgi:centromere/kinetochore protein ZW10